MTTLSGNGTTVEIDKSGNIRRLARTGHEVAFSVPSTYWELDGEPADARLIDTTFDNDPASLKSGQGPSAAEIDLKTGDSAGTLRLECGDAVSLRVKTESSTVSFSLSFADTARFHLPEQYNACRMIDREMTLHDIYETGLRYNFLIIEIGPTWLLVHLDQTGRDIPTFSLSRQPHQLTGTFSWAPDHRVTISLHDSLADAMGRYDSWLVAELQTKKLSEDTAVPGWVENVQLVITLDMMRSDWKIAHDYADVASLADELGDAGCPKDTLFYLPGTNGAYDAMYPDHGPHPELGGDDGFRRMVDALHHNGFRIMLHANAWGVDPCHPEIDRYLPYVLRNDDGSYEGWQTGGKIWGLTLPPSYKIKYRTGQVLVALRETRGVPNPTFTFSTDPMPDDCETLITFGASYSGSGRIRVSANHRTYISPAGWFADHSEYAFPFPFLLFTGENQFAVELVDDGSGDLSGCWYQVRDAFTFVVGRTYPILRADTENKEWIEIFLNKIIPVVREYEIDAVHVDATHYHRDAVILEAFRREIPQCAISGEELDSMGDLKVFAFCQNARLDLLADVQTRRTRESRSYRVDRDHLQSKSQWLDRMSPVWDFLSKYVRIYPHLCDADGFVPTAKVCSILPASKVPADSGQLRRVLADAKRLGYIPGLRLNYREHGLDDESRRAIQEIARDLHAE